MEEGNPDLYLESWPADSTVRILDKWFGAKGLGYDKNHIQYWNMDNEPEIWSGTHDDVMKTQCTAEEFMQLYFKVAKAARAKYPTIKLVGPVPANEWQWYNWSGGSKINGVSYPWLEFFIKRIAEEEKASGIKLLDVLDIHFYPGDNDAATCVQLHRIFFDRTYVYPGANGVKTVTGGWDASINKEYIFGRCSDWLTKYIGINHGVIFSVTELDIASTDPNVQAVSYASIMGEFMKQGVEIFTPWSWKVVMWESLHLFSKYNLKNYVQATSDDETLVSAYPTVNNSADSMSVVLVNRSLTDKKQVSLNFTGYTLEDHTYSMYSLSKLTSTETFVSHAKNALVKSDVTAQNNQITLELAPLSVNSLILKKLITSLKANLQKGNFKASVYPNPTSDLVHLDFSLPESGPLSIGLYNIYGQLLRTIPSTRDEIYEAGNHQIELNTQSLSGSVYWVKFQSATDIKTVKLIKKQ